MEAVVSVPGPSNPNAHNQFWRHLWSLKVPNKIRHFLWRASNDSQPTKRNLQKRNILPESTCERCGDNTEDTIHALWGCPMVKGTWWELEQCRAFLWEKFKCFHDLLQGVFAQNNSRMAELFVYIGWSIWYNRNARKFGTVTVPLEMIYTNAVQLL